MVGLSVTVRVPAFEKRVDHTASGIGSVAVPILARWRATHLAKARLIEAQANADALLIEAEAHSSTVNIIAEARQLAHTQLQQHDSSIRQDLVIGSHIEQHGRMISINQRRLPDICRTIKLQLVRIRDGAVLSADE